MTVTELIGKLRAFPGDYRVVVPGYELGMDDIEDPVEVLIQIDAYDERWNGPHIFVRKGKGGAHAVLLAGKRNGKRVLFEMIQIVVRLIPDGDKRRVVEHAVAEVTRVADETVCEYAVSAGENQNPVAGARDWSARGHIFRHDRRQSVWALVARIAQWAATEAEKAGR